MIAAALGTSARLHIKKARWKAGFGVLADSRGVANSDGAGEGNRTPDLRITNAAFFRSTAEECWYGAENYSSVRTTTNRYF